MNSHVKQFVTALTLIAVNNALSLSCPPFGQPDQLDTYQHVFMAEVNEIRYAYQDAPGGSIIKTTIGHLEPVDVIKGQPRKVPSVEFSEGLSIPGEYGGQLITRDKAYFVFSSQDGPIKFVGCFPVRIVNKTEAECVMYRFRQDANLNPDPNPYCEIWIESQLEAEKIAGKRAQEVRERIEFRKQERERIMREYSSSEDDT